MALPVSIPNTFANATASIPLANLDANFTTIYNAVNGIGNGSESLANVTIAGGIISNVTLDNVTVDVETLSNVTITNLTANGTVDMANATATTIGNANVTSVSVAFPNNFLANSNVTIGNTVVSLGDTITTINDTTLANANVASGNVTVTTVADQYGNVRTIAAVSGEKTTAYTLAKADVGRYVTIGSGGSINITDDVFVAGDAVSVFNNTNAAANIVCTITTAYIAGTDTDVASANLATRGVATVLFTSNVACVLTGNLS
jgi:hypothetical protein